MGDDVELMELFVVNDRMPVELEFRVDVDKNERDVSKEVMAVTIKAAEEGVAGGVLGIVIGISVDSVDSVDVGGID